MHSRIRIIVAGIAIVAAVSACGGEDAQNDTAESPTTTPAATTTTTPATTTTEPPSGPTAAEASPNDAEAEVAATIEVRDMRFAPETVTVDVGQTVRWVFADNGVPHAVQGLDDIGMELSSPILRDGTWSHTFMAPGTYKYICPLHPQMQATVIVR
ncbi:MAG: cupredoxin domain-containing protein [Aldersonia sp.]|nr:cupredoxin domain-containing protein [Aldersonia sp.]